MAITARAVGAWAASNATTQTVTLPTHVAGDMLIVRTIRKPFTSPDNTVINTSGWTAVATGVANGSTANGAGVGSMGFKAFYKIATSAAETNPVVTWGTTSAPGAAVAVSYQKAATEAWVTPSGNGGGDATARTSQTSTIASHISVKTGDLVDFFRGQCDDSGALTVPTITQTGVTYDTVTEYPATALLSGTSNDIAADGGYRTATAGTSSAAAVVTGTSAASEQHGAWMTRLRVNQAVTLPTVGGSAAAYAAEVLADGPAAYLRHGESSGLLQDSSGNARHATASFGTPTYGVAGAIGDGDTAIGYDGATEYFTVPDSAGLDFGDVFTIEGWVESSAEPLTLVCKGTGAYQLRIVVPGDSGTARALELVRTGVAEIVESTVSVPSTGWHQVAATKNGSTVHLYIDGADVTGTVTNSTFANTSDPLVIGATTTPGEFFNGNLDEVSVYPTELSAARILAHYNAAPAGPNWALYAPTVAQVSAASITLGLLDSGSALYAPTVQPDQFVTLGLLDAAPALYAPALVGKNTLTLALLDAAPALYAPTVVGKNTVTLALLDAAPALYAPTVIIDQFVTLGLLDAAPALYAPTLVGKSTVTLGLLDGGPSLFAPTVIIDQFVTLGLLDAASALYPPTVAPQAVTVTLGLVDAAPALYAPTLIQDQFVTLGLLDAGPALYAPTLAAKSSITLGLLDAAPALYSPTLVGKSTVTLGLLDSGSSLFAPTLSSQAVTVTLGLLDASPTLFAPTIAQGGGAAQGVTLGLLDGAPALYGPSFTATNAITLGLIDGAPALYPPTVSPDQFLTIPALDAGPALFDPTFSRNNTLVLSLLDAIPALHAPTLSGTQFLTIPLLDAGPDVYAPTIGSSASIVLLPLLSSDPDVYAPTIVGLAPYLIIPLIDAGRALYAPRIIGGTDFSLVDIDIVSVTDVEPGTSISGGGIGIGASGGAVNETVTADGAVVLSVSSTQIGVTVE